MEEVREIMYIKAPRWELMKLAKKCIEQTIPYEYNGSLEIKIMPVYGESWKLVLKTLLMKMEARCTAQNFVFEKQYYRNGVLVD